MILVSADNIPDPNRTIGIGAAGQDLRAIGEENGLSDSRRMTDNAASLTAQSISPEAHGLIFAASQD